jgi:hypothetical protein
MLVAFGGTYREEAGHLKQSYEHIAHDAWRMGRPEEFSARRQRARPMPVVLDRGASPPLHLLLGLLCPRMEAPFAARILARANIKARPGDMRSLQVGHPQGTSQAKACAGRHSPGAHEALGILDKNLWDADHILPVTEGGGECDLDNIRTLCLRCHRVVTAQLRERIRRAKVAAMFGAEAAGTRLRQELNAP